MTEKNIMSAMPTSPLTFQRINAKVRHKRHAIAFANMLICDLPNEI